jgi:hypothetical protein
MTVALHGDSAHSPLRRFRANLKGKKMPAYKGKLTDDQIKQLVGYIGEPGKKK